MESESNGIIQTNELKDKTRLKILHITDLHTDKYGTDNLVKLKENIQKYAQETDNPE